MRCGLIIEAFYCRLNLSKVVQNSIFNMLDELTFDLFLVAYFNEYGGNVLEQSRGEL